MTPIGCKGMQIFALFRYKNENNDVSKSENEHFFIAFRFTPPYESTSVPEVLPSDTHSTGETPVIAVKFRHAVTRER